MRKKALVGFWMLRFSFRLCYVSWVGWVGELGGLVGGRAQPRHLRFPKSLRIWGSLSFAFRSMAVGIYPPVQSGPILLR